MSITVYWCLFVPNYIHSSTIASKRFWSKVVDRRVDQGKKKDIERIFLTFQETQEFLNVSHQTLYKLIKEELPSHKIGKKRIFLKEDLEKWIRSH